ncbi:MAG: ATP-binding cassette domain-containing protein [Oscillospiraceae bacterium]|nr:ATP-binding cassette domain-containing protein [Oscillospiraceae bacterium]
MAFCVDIRKRLGNFSLNVKFEAENERLALLGSSGCGKSVTLRCIAGIMTPDEGHIELDGRVFFDSDKKICLSPQERRIGYLFQQYALFPNMTVEQNIAAAVSDRKKRRTVAAQMLRAFRLEDAAEKRPSQLSGGQQQRTALARILATEPQALLLDEPFSALDSYLRYKLELELMDTLSDFNGNVIWVSHDRGEVFRNCSHVCVIDNGKSEPVIMIDKLFHDPGTEPAARLSGCKNFAAVIPEGRTVRIPEWGISLQCGRPVPENVSAVGLRAHHFRFAQQDSKNAFDCKVGRIIGDVFSDIIMLSPIGSRPDAPMIRMETEKGLLSGLSGQSTIKICIAPEDVLLLH